MVREILKRYFGILAGKTLPKFLICKYLDYEELITEPEKIQIELLNGEKIEFERKNPCLLDRLIEEAKKNLEKCEFCERKCRVNRYETKGICEVGFYPKIASEFLHFGEESILIPSHTIFFSGCNFKCIYCQNWDISQFPESGEYIKPNKLAKIIEFRWDEGSRNVNWVGGDPIPNIHYILEVLKYLEKPIPQIFNTNFYLTEKWVKNLNAVVDLWLPDFKYGNNKCAEKYSKVNRYFEIITRNLKIIENTSDILIRHLILPNHVECCSKKIIDWLSKNMNKNSFVINIMDQYYPCYKAFEYEELTRRITYEEYMEVIKYAKEKELIIIE